MQPNMEAFSLALGVLVSVYVGKLLYVAFLKPGVSDVPGPLLAKFTDLWMLQQYRQNRRARVSEALHKQYGSLVRIGPTQFSTSHPEAVELIHSTKNEFVKSDQMMPNGGILNGKVVHGLVSQPDKKLHAAARKPIATVYSMTSISGYEPFVDDNIRLLVKRLSEVFIATGKPCDIDHWLQYYAYDVITEMTMSRRQGFLEHCRDVDNMIQDLNTEMGYKGLMMQAPWLDWWLAKNPVVLTLRRTTSRFLQRAHYILQQRMQDKVTSSEDGKQDMVSRFLDINAKKPDEFPRGRISAVVSSNLTAGSDTTAASLRSVIYHLLKSPRQEAVRRLQKELDAADLRLPAAYQDTQKLPYLDATIKESMRLHFIVPSGLERVVPASGLTLPDGRSLPPGACVMVDVKSVHTNKDVWGADADSFNPDRWLRGPSETEQVYNPRLRRMNATYMAWGRASRICLGKNIATLEMYKVIATLFSVFDMDLVDPSKEWTVTEAFFRVQSDMDINIRWRPGKSLQSLE